MHLEQELGLWRRSFLLSCRACSRARSEVQMKDEGRSGYAGCPVITYQVKSPRPKASCRCYLSQAAELNSISFAARLAPRESGLEAELGAFRGQMGALYLFDDVLTVGKPGFCRPACVPHATARVVSQ